MPIAERPWFREILAEPDPVQRLELLARNARIVRERTGALPEIVRQAASVDEQKVLAQLDKILNLERELKRTQLMVALRIKNKLTEEQQNKLRELHHKPPQQPQR